MQAKDVMTPWVATIGPDATIRDAARSWWLCLLGMTGENAAADFAKTHATRVRDAMTAPVVSVTEATPLGKIALLLEKRRIKRVPVVRAGRLVGIVSRADLWGGVRSDAEKRALRVAAEGVPGVRRIEDHTFVMPPRLIGALGAQ